MSLQSIGELARSRSLDYSRSSRKKKGAILDEFVAATGVKRKTAITLLRDPPPVKSRPRGKPKERYGADVRAALELLWNCFGPHVFQAVGSWSCRPGGDDGIS